MITPANIQRLAGAGGTRNGNDDVHSSVMEPRRRSEGAHDDGTTRLCSGRFKFRRWLWLGERMSIRPLRWLSNFLSTFPMRSS